MSSPEWLSTSRPGGSENTCPAIQCCAAFLLGFLHLYFMVRFGVGDYLKSVYVTCLRAHKGLLSHDDNGQ